ncbi:M56 family metallopeptidase [Carboxylicivirga linearis]|uniref:Carboxypeptidase-like regulatory domain-containing protein n=1 Tax=Carboxylicivirga linearis TaxID=1628157 RepID=A0ABS5JWW8_9BACT|nr:M56 family metallopeptidase [Carboxylicivirga linearis]MBS2099319.1 carboxypeptidase-like regulatory domain-containing protein [Carboxylicivirga linearis]
MDLLTYFTRSITILFSFTVMYLIAFRKDGHFTLYRGYLLLGLIATLFLPMIELSYTIFVQPIDTNNIFKEVAEPVVESSTAIVNEQSSFNWMMLLPIVYFLGVLVFASRILFGVYRIMQLRKMSRKVERNGVVYFISKNVSEPFTFGHSVFLDDESYLNDDNSEILAHEKVHLYQNHWVDVLLSEILIVIQWFNPFAWYYGRLVKQNLEFLADRGVLNQGYSIEKYIQSIICVTMGAEASVLANHFRFSQNKRRLKMMKNVRKSKWRQLKLLLTLPLIGGFLWAFSQPNYQLKKLEDEGLEVTSIKDGKKVTVKGQVGIEDTTDIMNPNTGEVKRMIVLGPVPGVSIVLKGKTIGCVSDMDGKFTIEASEDDILVFSFVGFKTEERKVEEGKEIVVALKPTSYAIDPGPFRERYKGKITPPPPPPPPAPKIEKKEIALPPPPPPPTESDEPVFFVVEDLPKYNGGIESYAAALYSSITMAKEKQELNGIVKVKFTVNAKGDVVNVNAIDKKGKEAEVAEKIVARLNSWIPGKQRGKPIACTMVVPVEFD